MKVCRAPAGPGTGQGPRSPYPAGYDRHRAVVLPGAGEKTGVYHSSFAPAPRAYTVWANALSFWITIMMVIPLFIL